MRENLPDLTYSFFLLRILHYMHALCFDHPDVVILISKMDTKLAYRQCSLCGDMCAICIAHLDIRSILNLRQSFGRSFGPYLFYGLISEHTTGLSNDMLSCAEWDEALL